MGNVPSSDSEEEGAPSPPPVVARGRRHQQPAKESSHQHHQPAVPVAGATAAVSKNQAKKRALRSLSSNRVADRGDAKKPATEKSRPQRSKVILLSQAPHAAKEEATEEESKTKVRVLLTKRKQSTWNARYRELVRFKREHGHCRVPQKEEAVLQKWLYEQKRRREGPFQGQPQLTQAEFDKLEAVGITWTYRSTFKQNLEHLVRFQQIHGHCEVPTTNADLQPLAQWVNVQKHRRVGTYKKQSQLTLDMIAKLDAIGFEWALPEDEDDDDDEEQDRTSETVNASSVRLKSSLRSRAAKRSGTGSSRQNSCRTTQANKGARTMGIAKSDDDEEDVGFACKVHWMDGTTTTEVGFILLPSRAFTTFADARQCIGDILVDTEESSDWVFRLPVLGAVSKKQEIALGSMWNFLKKADPMGNENFTCEGDAKVIVAKREPVLL